MPSMPRSVSFTPSQTGRSTEETPLPWTASPVKLLISDLRLFLIKLPYVVLIFWPLPRHPTDELYPTWKNIWTIAVHIFLVIYQVIYLLSIPFLFALQTPAAIFLFYLAVGFALNQLIAKFLLNGNVRSLDSRIDLSREISHPGEVWLFYNGVAVGHHWLQANIDLLSQTFRRPIRGILNETYGFIFDLVQCLIERNFAYATADVRFAYNQVKLALLNPSVTKVVLILHSQGGIQGSLALDWLLTEIPHSLLIKLEIYTFGNAANHFNNPHVHLVTSRGKSTHAKPVAYIEHYSNDRDFVAQWGVLHFTAVRNRYMGRIFRAPASGHLLNQHYLDSMFSLDANGWVADSNKFMDAGVNFRTQDGEAASGARETRNAGLEQDDHGQSVGFGSQTRESRESLHNSSYSALHGRGSDEDDDDDRDGNRDGAPLVEDINSPVQRVAKRPSKTVRVKDFSRLWQYRNGMSPKS